MIRAGVFVLCSVAWLASGAAADPATSSRVVLADLDPELRHAMAQALAPWQLDVVVQATPPADLADARERAAAQAARFIVWRDGDELVVYDAAPQTIERRATRAGTLAPPAAAAAALTLKTMMRLPPLAASGAADPAVVDRADTPQPSDPRIRVQLAISARVTRSTDVATSVRFGGAAALRLGHTAWRLGVAGDRGSSTDVSRAGFKGSWSEWGLLGITSWTYARDAWEVEPYAGAGIRRSILAGTEMSTDRREEATLAALRGGAWVRRRLARWTVGAGVAVDAILGAPTYLKQGAAAEVFQVPGVGVEVGLVTAVDL